MKATTPELDPQAFAKLRELIQEIDVAMVTTVTPSGSLHSRPMITADVGEKDAELWFFTSTRSGKAHDLAAEQGVNVCYADPSRGHFVSVTGSASVLHDRGRVHELWSARMEEFFPTGTKDPDIALIRVRVETAEFWETARAIASDRRADDNRAPADGNNTHKRIDIRATPASG